MMNAKEQGLKPSRWDQIGFINRFTYFWTLPWFRLGWGKELIESDLEDCPKLERSDALAEKLEREWHKELTKEKNQKNYKASLRMAVIRTYGKLHLQMAFVAFILECVVRVIQPVCLGWVIRYFSNPGSLTDLECYLAAGGICVLSLVYVILSHPVVFINLRTGMRLRVATCTLIYKKALKLSQRALGETTVGQMVNLLSNDVNRFDLGAAYISYLVIGPLQTIIVISILWGHLGPSSLFGLLVLLMLIPFQSYMGKLFSKLRSKIAILTDERVRLMNEIVAAMRVIKMYTWEFAFANLVALARRNEVSKIRYTSFLRGINIAVYFAASKVIVFVCFVAYILFGNTLTAEKVFVSMSLYNNLRLTMTFLFPVGITHWAECTVSLTRIQKFLRLEEQSEMSTVKTTQVNEKEKNSGLWMNSVFAKWSKSSEEMTLNNINMDVKAGELWAIVGPVGSGKSSLLMSILGELPCASGNIKIRGTIAYSSQEPWVFGGTIRQNILFGLPMDKYKYQRILHVCALDKDIKSLPYGDQTLVGERGVSLSGGQKARVNLARSIYMDGDVYLMDDPLSAVDVSVAKHLFDKCINGHIKKKARVLVTHQVQFLKSAHRIIILKHGNVLAIGGYHELVSQGYDLLAFVDEEVARQKTGSMSSQKDELNLSPLPILDNKSDAFGSVSSLESLGIGSWESAQNIDAPKQEGESKSQGSIGASTYIKYIRAGAGVMFLVFVVVANLFAQILYTYSDYWLSQWTNAEEKKSKEFQNQTDISNSTLFNQYETVKGFTFQDITGDFQDTNTNIYIYSGLMASLFLLSLLKTGSFFWVCMGASVNLHNTMFKSVCRTPIAFFDKNPVGRILNRFTKDLGLIDDLLPFTMVDFSDNFLTMVGVVVIVIFVSPFVAIPTFALILVFIFLRRIYIRTARDLKRLEGTTRSPVFSHLSTSLYGISTIRSFGVQKAFENDFCAFQDNHTSTFFTLLCVSRWFGIVLDQLTVVYISFLTIFLFAVDTGNTGGNVGLAMSSALGLTGIFQFTVRQSAELESQMTAVERVLEYSKLKPEAELEAPADKKPPPDWPQEGKIVMENFSLTYPDTGNVPVLRNLNCHIRGGEKVGIVGRTGAGKSSIIAALFRMAEPSGTLTIDGIKSHEIGLHDLRKKISIIPQDPILFSGPIRRNLDPFNDKKDEELWEALEEVQLKEAVLELSGGLDSKISEGGSNFSVGQRQLICLARALLRRNKILVLDEATANVDHKTDALIQHTIREKFNHCTVLTIAHRLNTIMDSDKILVLDAGKIMEFDEPMTLLECETSQLADMVRQAGPVMARQLIDIARESKRPIQKEKGPTQLKEINTKSIETTEL